MAAVDRVDALAERVRRVIRSDPREGAIALVLFASTNAVTPRLKHEALLLKFNQAEAGVGRTDQHVERHMLDLVDRIERDCAQYASAGDMVARQRAWEKLREHYLAEIPASEPVVSAKRLGKRYRNTDFHLAGVDLTLRAGEITAIVGQNAHGKTTLLRIVAGELRADEGILSYPILEQTGPRDWIAIKSQIAYLPQELPSWSGSLIDNLHYAASLHGVYGQDNEREVDFVIERLGLRAHLGKRWSELSGGYKMRFTLAQVLTWKPKLLILDEPLANLDVVAQSRLLQDIVDVARSRRFPLGVLMSSQHLHELEAVANTMVFLNAGNVVFNGLVSEIGSIREHNLYELGAEVDAIQLRQVLEGLLVGEPQHNGVSHVLRTPREVETRHMLQRLLERGIDVRYFRDISRSIKSLFE